MPIYPGRRADAKTWRIVLWIRIEKRQREWLFEGSKSEARDYETQLRSQHCGPSKAAARSIPTLLDFITRVYEPHARAHLRSSTWNKSRKYYLAAITPHLGALRMDAVDGPAVEQYKLARLRDGLKPSTLNRELQALATILRWAREKMDVALPELKIDKLKETDRRVHVWTGEEVARVYGAVRAHSPHLLPILEFLLNTGCRKGEAVAAEWSWVDWPARMLRIPVGEVWRPKSGRSRDVPIDGLLPMLRTLPRTHARIFLSTWGTPFAMFPDQTFRECMVAGKIKGTPHTTRHTYASHFLQRVPDLGLLAQVLGHSHTRVTELYAHFLPGHLERARGAVRLAPPSPTRGGVRAVRSASAERRRAG